MTASKQRAIRNALARLGLDAKPRHVVDALAGFGIEVTEDFVMRVKEGMRREESRAVLERSKRTPTSKKRSRPQQRKIPPRRG